MSLMTRNILDFFPKGFTPQKEQKELLNNIKSAFDSGKKFVVVCAPTGSGKSFVSKTLGNMSNPIPEKIKSLINSYEIYKQSPGGGFYYQDEVYEQEPYGTTVLTITKTLQDQYTGLFNDITLLKGKSNYQCSVDDNFTVDVAPCIFTKTLKQECWKQNCCPYYKQRNEMLTSHTSVLNYSMFFSMPSFLKRREYMICDEASELEEQIVKQFTCVLKPSILVKCGVKLPVFNIKNPKIWLNIVSGNLYERITELSSANKSKVSPGKNVATFNFLKNLHAKISQIVDCWDQSEFISETDKDQIKFVPSKVNKLSKHIFKHADKIVLMSATIIDHKNFCKTLGITEYEYIEVESAFDPKNAPIYIAGKNKLTYHTLQNLLPSIKKQIVELCEHHKNEKGIIHTHTNTITTYLQNNIKSDRFIFRESGVNNEDILDKHLKDESATVIVSPSMMYGVDLKGDLAKFQIIVKAPYMPLFDKRVKKLTDIDQNWYINKMLGSLVQGCGRGVRSKTDKCITYILDGVISEKILQYKDRLPKHFIDRFI
jgi:ATP-dependent DNA helicase DinG